MRFSVILSILPLGFAAPQKRAPLFQPRGDAQVVPDKYIVKLKDDVPAASFDKTLLSKADHVFKSVFNGFTTTLKDGDLDILLTNPSVEYVEQDAIFTTAAAAYVEQPDAPWGLARISSLSPGTTTYVYDSSSGSGTCAYILDTGIDATHPDFTGRASQIANFVDDTTTDGNGHGTHIAGIIGGEVHGVAKQTILLGVKILADSGSGTTAGVIAGMEFVTEDSPAQNCPNGVVVNMSIGGAYSAAVNSAGATMVEAGIFVSVAAGNSNDDASNYSPASEPSVCTVGASDRSDNVGGISNYGSVIDVFAPGRDITSTWIDGGTQTISGTSMAAAHVCGLGAYLAALEGVGGEHLCSRIQELALVDVLSGVPDGTVNLLAFNGNPNA